MAPISILNSHHGQTLFVLRPPSSVLVFTRVSSSRRFYLTTLALIIAVRTTELNPSIYIRGLILLAACFPLSPVLLLHLSQDLLGLVEDPRRGRSAHIALWRLDEPIDRASGVSFVLYTVLALAKGSGMPAPQAPDRSTHFMQK